MEAAEIEMSISYELIPPSGACPDTGHVHQVAIEGDAECVDCGAAVEFVGIDVRLRSGYGITFIVPADGEKSSEQEWFDFTEVVSRASEILRSIILDAIKDSGGADE